MNLQRPIVPAPAQCISLVDGDPTMRRERQLMLRSENYEVRAYPSCAALLADPSALRSACVIADFDMGAVSGLQLLQGMRKAGWNGSAILLAETVPPGLAATAADEHFVAMLPKALAHRPLLDAVRKAIGLA